MIKQHLKICTACCFNHQAVICDVVVSNLVQLASYKLLVSTSSTKHNKLSSTLEWKVSKLSEDSIWNFWLEMKLKVSHWLTIICVELARCSLRKCRGWHGKELCGWQLTLSFSLYNKSEKVSWVIFRIGSASKSIINSCSYFEVNSLRSFQTEKLQTHREIDKFVFWHNLICRAGKYDIVFRDFSLYVLGRVSPTSIKSRFSWTRFNVDRRFEPSSSHDA